MPMQTLRESADVSVVRAAHRLCNHAPKSMTRCDVMQPSQLLAPGTVPDVYTALSNMHIGKHLLPIFLSADA
jgi:hypothetical protein